MAEKDEPSQTESAAAATAEVEQKEIFLSYGREPEVNYFVKQIKRDLEENGFSVWLDLEDIPAGSDWHGSIGTGLTSCSVLIPVITQKYIGSRYCMNELYTADGDHKLIFPVMFEDVDFNSTEAGRGVKFVIAGINWTMCRPGVDDYSASIEKLVTGMREKGVGEGAVVASQTSDSGSSHNASGGAAAVCTVGPISNTPLHMVPITSPQQVTVGIDGEIAVASYQEHTLFVYNQECELLRKVGGQGFVDGRFLCPGGVATCADGDIFVSSFNKIQRFTIDGKFITAVGEQGKGELQFNCPNYLAVGKEGRVYVAETQNNRVQILNSDLTYHGSIFKGSSSLGAGVLNQPHAVAVNSEGSVYVADTMNHAVQVFSPDGEFLFKFGKFGASNSPGVTSTPMAIAIDPEDNVFVGSTGVVSIFNKEGKFLRTFGTYGSELGQFNLIRGLHVDRYGTLYVSEWTTNRMQVFAGSPKLRSKAEEIDKNKPAEPKPKALERMAYSMGPECTTAPFKVIPCDDMDIEHPQGIAVGKNGEIVVSNLQESNIVVFNKDFELVLDFKRMDVGKGSGCMQVPAALAIDENNDILITSAHRLHKFTMSGELVQFLDGKNGFSGKEKLQFDGAHGIAIGKDGRIYISEEKNKRIQVLNSDFTFHSFITNPNLKKRSPDRPAGVAINSEGNVFLADSGANCVMVFSPDGKLLFKMGEEGPQTKRGVLNSPFSIAIDREDFVYVGCPQTISIFDKTGKFIKCFGGYGEDPGQFKLIRGLHVDQEGTLYVTEWSFGRIQIFK